MVVNSVHWYGHLILDYLVANEINHVQLTGIIFYRCKEKGVLSPDSLNGERKNYATSSLCDPRSREFEVMRTL